MQYEMLTGKIIVRISKLKGEDLKAYRYSMRYVDERKLAIEYAVEEAVEELMKETGRKVKTAFKRGKLEDAKAMLIEGFDPTVINRITKLPMKQIMALR